MDKNSPLLSEVPATRHALIELLFTAISAALAVNLLSNSLSKVLGDQWSLIAGSILLVFTGIFIFRSRWRKHRANVTIDTLLLTKRKDESQIIKIENYDFNFQILETLHALFAENPSFYEQWKNEPLSKRWYGKDTLTSGPVKNASYDLLKEAVEYIVLDQLSTHLNDYFNHGPFDDRKLITLEREDVSNIVMRNRVLDLISKDIRDRPIFSNNHDHSNKYGVLYATSTDDGALYARFDLTLPKGSKISYNDKGRIVIENKDITIQFWPDIRGMSHLVDPLFLKTYVRDGNLLDLHAWEISIKISVDVKTSFFSSSKKLAYYQWAESFLESVKNRFDFDIFMDEINWKTVSTLLQTQPTTSGNKTKKVRTKRKQAPKNA